MTDNWFYLYFKLNRVFDRSRTCRILNQYTRSKLETYQHIMDMFLLNGVDMFSLRHHVFLKVHFDLFSLYEMLGLGLSC